MGTLQILGREINSGDLLGPVVGSSGHLGEPRTRGCHWRGWGWGHRLRAHGRVESRSWGKQLQ